MNNQSLHNIDNCTLSIAIANARVILLLLEKHSILDFHKLESLIENYKLIVTHVHINLHNLYDRLNLQEMKKRTFY